jgi:hypothetical protein
MGLSSQSIYASLASKYEIRTPANWEAVDLLIRDIKLSAGQAPGLAARLEALVSQARTLPVVLARSMHEQNTSA